MDPYRNPEAYAGIVVKDGDDRGKIHVPNPIPHRELVIREAEMYLTEIDELLPKIEVFKSAQYPPSDSAVITMRERLVSFVIECKLGWLSKSDLFGHLADVPLIREALAQICDTGQSPVGSLYDIPDWAKVEQRKLADEMHRRNSEANAARKKERDEEQARLAEQEKKRKQLADDLGLNLGALARTG